MKALFIILTFIFLNPTTYGQEEIDSLFDGFTGYAYKKVRSDSNESCYKVLDRANTIFCVPKTAAYLKVFDTLSHLKLEGELGGRVCSQRILRNGKWTLYYESGKPQIIGYYSNNNPTGLWQYYFESGSLKKSFTYSIVVIDSLSANVKVGQYKEFYEDGKPKIVGLYKTTISKTLDYDVYDLNGNKIKPSIPQNIITSQPFGFWEYYDVSGKVEIKEE